MRIFGKKKVGNVEILTARVKNSIKGYNQLKIKTELGLGLIRG